MARMITSVLIDDIRGAVGNLVFDNWKGVQVIRRKSISRANPHSRLQNDMRQRVTQTSKRWQFLLTQAQRDRWNEFAQRRNRTGPRPKPGGGSIHESIPEGRGPQTGYNSFQMLNALGFSADVFNRWTWILDAPLGNPPPGMHSEITVTWNATFCRIALEWVNPVVMVVNTRTRVWIHALSAGIHLQLAITLGLTQQSVNLPGIRIAQGKPANIRNHPGLYTCQLDAIGPDGQKGPSSAKASVVVPPGCTL